MNESFVFSSCSEEWKAEEVFCEGGVEWRIGFCRGIEGGLGSAGAWRSVDRGIVR